MSFHCPDVGSASIYFSLDGDIVYASAATFFKRIMIKKNERWFFLLDEVDDTFARHPFHLVYNL